MRVERIALLPAPEFLSIVPVCDKFDPKLSRRSKAFWNLLMIVEQLQQAFRAQALGTLRDGNRLMDIL